MKVARIYLRVSTDEQDLARQAEIEQSTRSSGYYIAGVYREKAWVPAPTAPNSSE
jgi:DNA invertase Pin-like site-specific DNA recombinase